MQSAAQLATAKPSMHKSCLMRWLQLRIVFNSTAIRPRQSHCIYGSGPRYDHSTTYYYYYYYNKSTDYSDASQSYKGTLHIRFRKKNGTLVRSQLYNS